MAKSRAEVAKHVLAYFRANWPKVVEKTNLRKNLFLRDAQILNIGAYFNGWQGIFLRPLEVLACATIGDLIDLIWSKMKPN